MVHLNFLRWLQRSAAVDVRNVLFEGGALLPQFQALAQTTVLKYDSAHGLGGRALSRSVQLQLAERRTARRLRTLGTASQAVDLIYLNSVGTLRVLPYLAPGPPVVAHLHEMKMVLRGMYRAPEIRQHLARIDRYIVPSRVAHDALLDAFPVSPDRVDICHELLDVRQIQGSADRGRKLLGVSPTVPVVLAAGTVEWRKGVDLFVQLGLRLHNLSLAEPPLLVWVGGELRHEPETRREVQASARAAGLEGMLRWLDPVDDLGDLLAACDVFVLPSREDAFPLVCLMAAAVGKPIVTFDRGVGTPDLLGDALACARYLDLAHLADVTAALLRDKTRAQSLGQRGRERVGAANVEVVAPHLWHLLNSVVLDALQLKLDDPRGQQV